MIYRIGFTSEAIADLDRMALWLNVHGSEAAANRWLTRLLKSLKSLERLPEIHPIAEDMSELAGFPVRETLFGKRPNVYRILYTVDADAVNVIAIRHAAQEPIER